MARDYYFETITAAATDGTMKALSNIEVKIKEGDSATLATVYANRSGATTRASEFTIPDSTPGMIDFWANKGEYDIHIHDLNPIPRIADFVLHWTSSPLSDEVVAFDLGDIKFSSKSIDHGRWLKMDGRELSQAQIESALGLVAGDGYAITAELGTGAASKYGTAVTDKIKLPDTRRQIPMVAGPSGDGSASFSARPLKGSGSTGGVETVTLAGIQSGMPAHTHSVSDPGHSHGASTGSTAPAISVSDPGHGHTASSGSATPSITVSDPGHSHTGWTDAQTPAVYIGDPGHSHGAWIDSQTPAVYISDPGHYHFGESFHSYLMEGTGHDSYASRPLDQGFSQIMHGVGATAGGVTGVTASQAAHSHNVGTYSAGTGIWANQAAHSHGVGTYAVGTGVTASQAAHSHSVTVNGGATGVSASQAAHSHTVSVSSGTTGLTVTAATAVSAASSHENMPPFVTLGYAFLRV